MDGKFLFVVAQKPFDVAQNRFCTVLPIWSSESGLVDAARDFPGRGLCWFMLRDAQFQDISPGQLIYGAVEHSQHYQSSGSERDWWQVRLDTAEFAGKPGSVVEIIAATSDVPDDPRALIAPGREFTSGHRPATLVIVALGGWLYGPFRSRVQSGSREGRWLFHLERTSQGKVFKVGRQAVAQKGWVVAPPEALVSLEEAVPSRAMGTMPVNFQFLPWAYFDQLAVVGAQPIELLRDDEVLMQAAREHLKPRHKQRELKMLLEQLVRNVESVPAFAEALAIAKRLGNAIDASDRFSIELTEALIESGALEAQIASAIESKFATYVESRAASTASQIEGRVAERQAELDKLNAEVDGLTDMLADERRKLDAELATQRTAVLAELQTEREQQEKTQRESEGLVKAVQAAADRFTTGRGEFMSQLLALTPALRETGVLVSESHVSAAAVAAASPAALPAPFLVRHPSPGTRLAETTFFERFAAHVENQGFNYRDDDLRAFHLLVKCADMTVLGGLSGTGKSSLVRLYSEAMAGEDRVSRERLLTVDVSPAWTEPQDLLGSVNLLDRRFEPASCGLFRHLVRASREYAEAGTHAGMVLVLLDEMNLAQVEHYFTGIFQALERPAPRHIRVFDGSALQAVDPLQGFAELGMPPTLRFVGTVNFDETTRPLSQRLKDRAAILELRGARHAGLQAGKAAADAVVGAPILYADMLAWRAVSSRIDPGIAEVIDRLNEPLLRLGAPITPRRMHAIETLLRNGGGLLGSESLLDIAISTRVLPMLRGLERPDLREAAGQVRDILTDAPGGCPDACRVLAGMLDAASVEWQGILDED